MVATHPVTTAEYVEMSELPLNPDDSCDRLPDTPDDPDPDVFHVYLGVSEDLLSMPCSIGSIDSHVLLDTGSGPSFINR